LSVPPIQARMGNATRYPVKFLYRKSLSFKDSQ
jgi:hypothetical protein